MITKMTEANTSKYDAFWAEIDRKSNGKIKVNSLEQYFGQIQEIASLDLSLLRLPLDEPMFEINADARTINVGATPFKQNGLSVQGDHIAEMIFFKIDRYYDYMDLNNAKIYVNWKNGDSFAKDECPIRSVSIEPGYLIFGWPIRNAITKKNGTLNFAVEFSITNSENQTTYKLNTLPANLEIKTGLILNNPEIVDNMAENIRTILFNSKFGEGEGMVGDVLWISELVPAIGDEFSSVINLAPQGNSEETLTSTPVVLKCLAAAGRDVEISYSDHDKVPMTPCFEAIPADAELNNNVRYYVLAGEDAYVPATESDYLAWENGEKVLYISIAKITVDKVGSYDVNAQGVKFDVDGETRIGASEVVNCKAITVPQADIPASVIITKPEVVVKEGYAINADENTIFLEEGEALELTATAEMPNGFGKLQFTWIKDNDEANGEKSGFVDEDSNIYEVTEQGKYKVKVEHYRNEDEIKSNISDQCVVSYYASPITATLGDTNLDENNKLVLNKSTNSNLTAAGGVKAITVNIDEVIPYSTSLSYQLIDNETKAIIPAKFTKKADGVVECEINSNNIDDDKDCIIKVFNNYNGSIYTAETNKFMIDIKLV